MKMKFKELPVFWKRTVVSLIFLNLALLIGLICYIWMTVGSLIQVMF